MDKYERYELERKQDQSTTASKGAHGPGGVLIAVICLGLLMYFRLDDELPDGSNCTVSESTYGVRDLDKTLEALNEAQKVNDQFGIAELVQHGDAGMVPEGTYGLVIDSDRHFFAPSTSYRRIRILDGVYMGKALWFKKSVLRLAEPLPGPCPDPHARRGSTGVCLCDPGWNYDPTTLKCIQ